MRTRFLAMAIGVALGAAPLTAAPRLIGQYRYSGGPDVAGTLEVRANRRFSYMLAAGALDERAEGRWERQGTKVCLFTEPRPVPPSFALAPRSPPTSDAPTLLVTWPNGRGIAGVDLRIGFDSGEPLEGYTQTYGWSMPQDDKRLPRWVELAVPMHGLQSARLTLDGRDRGTITVVLTPNDLGVVDFQGACFEAQGKDFVLHRDRGDMRFARLKR